MNDALTTSHGTTTMTAQSLRTAALLAALLLACSQQPKSPAQAAGATARGHAALTGDAVCAGPGVHDVHVALFRCDTCHPTGATFGFDRPYTFPSGETSTAGGTIVRDGAGTTGTVACHFPKRTSGPSVAWSAGPLACTGTRFATVGPQEE